VAPRVPLQLAGLGQEYEAQLLPTAAHGDGDAHVRMHLDLIGPEVQHHGTDFAAEGGADRHGGRGEGHRPQARRWGGGKGRLRPGLTLAASLARGIVGRPETVCRGEVGTTALRIQSNPLSPVKMPS
jgi:hypothetical protein